ncbi:MAG TPA: substrate-binding domain-containing protein [Candidatus Aquilonibacter sp.]|nr:substrate-binding domain-containing protein [Candidatus Aquilonibacter sp.]
MRRFISLALLVTLLAAAPSAAPVRFDVDCVDQLMDFHGDPARADLVVFIGGNEWFAVPKLVAAFQRIHPEVKNVYYETLPPGLLAEQMSAGALQVGGLVISVKPDVYIAGKKRMDKEVADGLVGRPVVFATNVLGIMVKKGNPKRIAGVADLGRDDVRVAMPNPKTEGIARQIEIAYRKAGGDELNHKIMVTKLHNGTTLMTQIHHRQTPMWILDGKADAGPVWISEALYQQQVGSGLIAIRIPQAKNVTALYLASVVHNAPHPKAAEAFKQFLTSPTAQAIYRSYGFGAPASTEE